MGVSGFKKTEDGIKVWLDQALSRKVGAQAYLNRVIYPKYQQAQINRWTSDNASEGDTWLPLKPEYATRKAIIYGGGPKHKWIGGSGPGRPWQIDGQWPSFPGGGKAMLIAKGNLVAATTGRGDGALKVVTATSLTAGIEDSILPYGKHVADTRPFMLFGDATEQDMVLGIADYLMRGKE